MLEEEERHGRAFLLAAVCLGVGAVIWFVLPVDPPVQAIGTGFAIFAGLAWRWRFSQGMAHYGTAAIALLLAGMLLAQWETWRRATIVLDSPVTTMISGVVERRESSGEGHWRYIVRLTATVEPTLKRPPDRVSLLARSGHEPIAIGAGIRGRARISPPSGPALPGLNDFAFAAYYDGIGAVGYFYGAPEAEPVAEGGDDSVLQRLELTLYAARSAIGDRIRSVVPGDAGAFAAAIVTDERRAISKETTEALRLSGLAHIIAISGLNMALAAGIFFVGVRAGLSVFTGFAQAYPVKKIAAFGALVTAFAYYLISGFAVSAERAFLMMAIMLIAVFFDRPSISLRNVALSAIVIIAMSPSEVMGASFQMSFAATLALVAGYALWKERPATEHASAIPGLRAAVWVFRFFGGVFFTSLIGGLATAIFSIEHFHKLATYGLVANLAAMPIISFVVMPAGLIGMLLIPFGLDAFPLQTMGAGLELVIAIARMVSGWGGEVAFGRLHPVFFPLSVAGFLVMTLLQTRLRHFGCLLILAGALAAFMGNSRGTADLIVAEDGRLASARLDGTWSVNRERPPDFIFAQWQRALAIGEPRDPQQLENTTKPMEKNGKRKRLTAEEVKQARAAMQKALTESEEGRFACAAKLWCVLRLGERRIALVDDPAYAGAACDAATLVIVSARLRFEACRSGALLITSTTLRRTGALEISLPENPAEQPRLAPAFENAERPWMRHRSYDWRSGEFNAALPASIAALIVQ